MSFLTATGLLGLKNWIWIAAVALLVGAIVAAVEIADRTHENTIEVAKQAGASKAVAAGNDTTFGQIGAANDAGNDIRNDAGFARYCECLLSATDATAGNCVRYLENKPVPGRSADPGQLCPGG